MKILLETVPKAFDLRQKELILQIISGLPLGKFQPIVNIGTVGFFGFVSIFFKQKKNKIIGNDVLFIWMDSYFLLVIYLPTFTILSIAN